MKRIVSRVVHNWPLKLGAIGLATLLYGGLVLSESARQYTGSVPVQVHGQPADTVLLTVPSPITLIRFFAPNDVPVGNDSFEASIDLTGVEARVGTVPVRVVVTAIDPRIDVLSYEPGFVSIQLDRLVQKTVPVRVERGTVPTGLELGETVVDPVTATVSGAESIVRLSSPRARTS